MTSWNEIYLQHKVDHTLRISDQQVIHRHNLMILLCIYKDYEKMPGDRRNSDALELGKKPGEPAVIQTDLATSSPDSVLVELPLNNGSIAGYSHSRPDNEQTIDDTTDAA